MRFSSYFLLPSASERRTRLRAQLAQLSPGIAEREEPGCLYVGAPGDVFQSLEQRRYFVSFGVVDALCRAKAVGFPVSAGRMQVASLCLRDTNVALSVQRGAGSVAAKQVRLMGGNCAKGDLGESVDVLVASKGTSKKVFQAIALGIPVVTEKWLEESFNEMRKLPFSAYSLPLFTGCTVSSTDLTSAMRNEMRKMVLDNGGKWEDSLNDETTYLVATNLSSTKKIGIALEENIPIVRPEWIRKVGNGMASKIEDYLINWWCMSEQKSSLFMNCVFQIHQDVSEFNLLEECIQIHSGAFGKNPTYYVVPSYFNINENNNAYVTPNWIFACIEAKKLLSPNIFPLYTPLPSTNTCIKGMLFSLIDLQERTMIADLIRAMGGNVIYKFSVNSSYIVSQTANDKLSLQSSNYNIPIVIPDFIIQIALTGSIPQSDLFAVKSVTQLCKLICDFNTTNQRDTKTGFSAFMRFEDNSSQIVLPKTQSDSQNDISYEVPTFTNSNPKFSNDPLIELIQSV